MLKTTDLIVLFTIVHFSGGNLMNFIYAWAILEVCGIVLGAFAKQS